MCRFIAYCVAELKPVFGGLLFWRFLYILPIVPNENTCHVGVWKYHARLVQPGPISFRTRWKFNLLVLGQVKINWQFCIYIW